MEAAAKGINCCCWLEVDVNGQETFMVDQKVITSYSRRLARLFSAKSMSKITGKMKLIFHDFPGGPEGFELMSRFCYNNGKLQITPHNVVLLNSVARFMEMDDETSLEAPKNLLHRTENSLRGIGFWSWSELLSALKQSQDLLVNIDSSMIARKIISSLIERVNLPSVANSCTSSSDGSSHRFSTDTEKCSGSRTWWFDDLTFLNISWTERVIKSMMCQEFDHTMIGQFLIHYNRSRFVGASKIGKRRIVEFTVDLLSSMDQSCLPWKWLFEVFRLGSGLRIGTSRRASLERLMGSNLDQATLDHLLLPSPRGRKYGYDVDLIIKISRAFLMELGGSLPSLDRLKKVGNLVDSFLHEVAADRGLRHSKFESLVTVLPEAARESHDLLYRSIDLFFGVHKHLSEGQKLKICRALNFEKLPADDLIQLTKNPNFPTSFRSETQQLIKKLRNRDSGARKYYRATEHHLQGTRLRILELEKARKILPNYMVDSVRSQKMSGHGLASYLPKFCSS